SSASAPTSFSALCASFWTGSRQVSSARTREAIRMRGMRRTRARAVERIDDASEADERVLDHLARLGCGPTRPCESRHFLYLPEPAGADAVAEELHRDGWLTSIE